MTPPRRDQKRKMRVTKRKKKGVPPAKSTIVLHMDELDEFFFSLLTNS
jgi:hypothetical protein